MCKQYFGRLDWWLHCVNLFDNKIQNTSKCSKNVEFEKWHCKHLHLPFLADCRSVTLFFTPLNRIYHLSNPLIIPSQMLCCCQSRPQILLVRSRFCWFKFSYHKKYNRLLIVSKRVGIDITLQVYQDTCGQKNNFAVRPQLDKSNQLSEAAKTV